MSGICRVVSLTAGLAVSSVLSASAQVPETLVGTEAACPSCRILIEPVAQVGDSLGDGFVGGLGVVLQSPDGRFFVSTESQPGYLLVFDAAGAFVERLGRSGQGPGEYTDPRPLSVSSGGILVVDAGRGRLTRLLGTDVDTWPLPFVPLHSIEVRPGLHVHAALPRSPALAGLPLHLFDMASGKVTKSFGNPSGRYDPRRPFDLMLMLGPVADSSGFWSAPTNHYLLSKWSAEGERVGLLKRSVGWFETWSEFNEPAWQEPPPPQVVGLREDEQGLLWVVVRVADAEWAPMEPRRIAGGHTQTTEEMKHSLYDTMVEVIDPQTGTLVTSRRLPSNAMTVAGDMIVTYGVEGLGHPHYAMWRMTLQAPGGANTTQRRRGGLQ